MLTGIPNVFNLPTPPHFCRSTSLRSSVIHHTRREAMKFWASIVAVAALLASPALGEEDVNWSNDPGLNERPANITGLAYWMYAWTGT